MVDQQIVMYIRDGLNRGYSNDSLKQALLQQGWKETDINEAIQVAGGQQIQLKPRSQFIQPKQAAPQQGIGILTKFIWAFKSPGQLFESVKSDHDLNNAFKYYVLMSLVPFLIAIVAVLSFPPILAGTATTMTSFLGPLYSLIMIFMLFGAIYIIALYITIIIFSFSIAGFFHIFAMLLRSEKNGYAQTYKSFSYALPPGIIGAIASIILLFTIPAQSIIILIVGIFFAAWYLFVSVIGLSHLHEISKGRAALVVIVPIIIMIAVFLVLFYFLLPLMMTQILGGMMSTGGLAGV